MAGNVWEWTDTWFSDGTYSQLSSEAEESGTTISNPKGPTDGSIYVIRGGSASSAEVNYYLSYLRSANRGYVNMSSSYFIGFRCVMEDNQ